MKCQSLFSEENKKNIINLLSAEYANSVVKVKIFFLCFVQIIQIIYISNKNRTEYICTFYCNWHSRDQSFTFFLISVYTFK